MRKVLTVALALILMVSLAGAFALGADQADDSDVAYVYNVDDGEVEGDLPGAFEEDVDIDSYDLDGVDKLVIVKPEGIKDGEWVQRANGDDDVMVWVDPISVGP